MLACATLITLDYHGGTGSPVEPARRAMGEVFGPVESAAASAVRPLTAVPDWFRSRSSMRREIATLAAENSDLRHQVATTDVDRNRLAEYDGLTSAASTLGQALVPARVVGIGAEPVVLPHRHHRRRLPAPASPPTRPWSTPTDWSAGCCG